VPARASETLLWCADRRKEVHALAPIRRDLQLGGRKVLSLLAQFWFRGSFREPTTRRTERLWVYGLEVDAGEQPGDSEIRDRLGDSMLRNRISRSEDPWA
jgi:hypothetical protein